MSKPVLSKKVIGSLLTLLVVAGCSSSGGSMRGVIFNVIKAPDWTGRVCESPIYGDVIGTYRGETIFSAGGRSCRWNTTLSVTGQNDGRDCNLTGYVETALIAQGPELESAPYACDSGKREVVFTNGLAVGDDLDSLRPVSIGITYPSTLAERNSDGVELVQPVRQYEHMTVEYEGLITDNGSLLPRQ